MKLTLPRVTSAQKTLAFWAVSLAVLALLIPHSVSGLGFMGMAMVGAIMDSRAEFADATAFSTAGLGLALVGNVMDTSVIRDLGNGRQVYLVFSIDTAVTSAGAATVEYDFVSDAQAAIAVDGTATVHYKSAAIPKATLIAGHTVVVALPLENPAYEQFIGILQNVGTAALTAGKFNAYLTLDPPRWKAYKNDPSIV